MPEVGGDRIIGARSRVKRCTPRAEHNFTYFVGGDRIIGARGRVKRCPKSGSESRSTSGGRRPACILRMTRRWLPITHLRSQMARLGYRRRQGNLCRKPAFSVHFRRASGGRQPSPPAEGGLGTRIPPRIRPGAGGRQPPRGVRNYIFMFSWTGQPRGSLDLMFKIRGRTSSSLGSKRSLPSKNLREKVGAKPPAFSRGFSGGNGPLRHPKIDDIEPVI